MDYSIFPPEFNSTRMYTGPGAGSLLASAGSWDAVAAELNTTAETYESVIGELTSVGWFGPASQAMTAAVIPYMGWLFATAEQTQQTAMQARSAAAAFEQAFATTVPPPLVAANRAQLMLLIATNLLGQNTAAIAATEAEYAEMWAQDAVAMNGYATASAAASMLTPFVSPEENTDPAGLAAQDAAVNQANSAAATDPVSQLISQLLANYNQWVQGLDQWAAGIRAILVAEGSPDVLDLLNYLNDGVSSLTSPISAFTALISVLSQAGASSAAPFDFSGMVPALAEGLAPVVSALETGGVGSAISAAVRQAGFIGPLSVPPSWAAPSVRTVSALSGSGMTTLPGTEGAEAGMPGVPGAPIAAPGRAGIAIPRYGVKLTVMPRPPAAG
ncbi:hypothetical protein A5634_05610 [Mycobacterium asiaticum]|uniref:PPE family protein n=1 Tax=Mycobacterium asiaticum TaxID=1790 RepID=A0A1A3NSD0_MYCAS|nr:PPE family protein [Mycobacterium asiaticum]OBK23237.1 hypothetical protein A5634_05610 [Mycobacterium asiaticum]